MTPEEWQRRMDACEDESEMKYLLTHKPKGMKAVRTGVPVYAPVSSVGGRPLLGKLQSGGR